MLGSVMLEVAIGVIFVYILISVICTALREVLEAWLKTRAAYLERGIRELLRDPDGKGLAKSFYEHPLVRSLYSEAYSPGDSGPSPRTFAKGRGLPSYIPARNFALVLMDMAARGPATDAASSGPDSAPLSLESVRANVLGIQNPAVQRVLLTALDSARGDFDRAVRNLEDWFDSGMDRVSGWYKRSTQWIIFWTALIIVVILNVDTLRIANVLYRDDAVRAAVVARAETAARRAAAGDTLGNLARIDTAAPASATTKVDTTPAMHSYLDARTELDALKLPIGWAAANLRWVPPAQPDSLPWVERAWRWFRYNIAYSVPGWLLTALAATLGAPFWFDVLNKLMVIRSTVKPKEKSQPESSEDRQIGWARGSEARDEALADAVAAGAAAGRGAPGGGAGKPG